jgi:N-acetylneuraminate synthase
MAGDIVIAGRAIGSHHRPFVVAEMSANHNGSHERALAIVDAAAAAGADAIKLQTYRADTITLDHDGAEFRIEDGPWAGRRLYELYDQGHTPWEWHESLFCRARQHGLIPFSAPFDPTAVEFLETLDAPIYKIASAEIVDLPLIERVAATGKPIFISTGMADRREIEDAVETARDAGARDVVLLHCVSGYPTPAEEANLRTIPDLAERFGVIAGLSDHSLGIAVTVAAVTMGASVIEKHLTLRRADGGLDTAFSLEPEELSALVRSVRDVHAALGRPTYDLAPSELPQRKFRRSLYVVRDMSPGDVFSHENLRSIRPANGMPPKMLRAVIGRRASRAVRRGEPLDWSMVETKGGE